MCFYFCNNLLFLGIFSSLSINAGFIRDSQSFGFEVAGDDMKEMMKAHSKMKW